MQTTEELRERAAETLGWSYRDACSFSLPTLVAAVRLVNAQLAAEIVAHIREGRHVPTPVVQKRRA